MTSPALAKLLGPKPTEPQPIEWIKVRRHAPYVRLVVPACEVCGDSAGEVPWYHAKTGRARCMRCFKGCHEAREARRRGAPAPAVNIQAQGHAGTAEAVQAKEAEVSREDCAGR